MKKAIAILSMIIAATLGAVAYSFTVPIKWDNKCHDENIYKYKLGIYKIDTLLVGNLEYQKIGGLREFLNLRMPQCMEEIRDSEAAKTVAENEKALKAEGWKKLKCGLFINKSGDIGMQDFRAVDGGRGTTTYYITRFGFNDGETLKSVIDTATFRKIGDTFYKDKNHIYHFYGMAYGGQFYIFNEADYATFTIIGDCYAKDKNHIYERRSGIMNSADHSTFRTAEDCGCFAKDRNGYYSFEDKIKKEYLAEPEIKKGIEKLESKLKKQTPQASGNL